ncbi:MAG: nucleotidyltransferase substrate binding protein [Fusobacteriaceae bacterium]|nr:nucleotidyltransferase substrate binding protein [Fusobacteriaceae bacterium]
MNIRWVQRYNNYKKALKQLKEAVELTKERKLSNLEKQGLVQAYEFTQELSWKVLKDFMQSRGTQDLYGSKDVVREAFKIGLLENGDVWMEMIKSRNLTSHTYDEATIEEIIKLIIDKYYYEFNKLN